MSVVQQWHFAGFDFPTNHVWPETWGEQESATDNTQAVPGSDAAPARDARAAPRIVKITGHIGGTGITDRQSFRDACDAFKKAVRLGKMGQLTKESDRYLNAKCISRDINESQLICASEFDCSFICPDPFFYSTASSMTSVSSPTSGQAIVQSNDGTAPLYSVWTITPGDTAVGTITLTNTDSGLSWTFGPTSLTSGQDLVVDATNGTCTLNGTNALAALSGVLWAVEPDGANLQIDFTGITAVTSIGATARYRYY